MIETILQLLATALALGSAYALTALGFVLIINAVGAVNFAQGDLVMAGGFVAVALATLLPEGSAVPGLILLPAVLLVMAGGGVLLAAVAYAPLRNGPPVSVFISTIAVGLILQHAITLGAGPHPRVGPPLLGDGVVSILGIALSPQQIATIAVAGVLCAAVHTLLHRTRFGRRLRAAAQYPEMARACGIDVRITVGATFALAGALAGGAGLLLSNQYFVTPTDGATFMLKAYIATVVGGWGRVWGAAIAALGIAVFEVLVAAAVSYLLAEALLYFGVLVLLLVRPQGLFGEAQGRRA
jgi:branched-chain amino acid transport system permease protein